MIVVSDTGPLNYLSLIGHLDVLPTLYGQVVIPRAVADELSRPASPAAIRAQIQAPPAWLQIDDAPAVAAELSALGAGEQQAIALAESLHADLLLCDDRDAREAAVARQIRVVGTLGVLQEAAQAGLLDLASALNSLSKTNFRIAKPLIERILREWTQP